MMLTANILIGTSFAENKAPKRLTNQVDRMSTKIESKVIKWRRHFHQNPELSNREFKTAKFIAQHLRKLGMEVKTGIAHTGVIGLLKGGKPGPVVALRADMDALPVKEQTSLSFASKVITTYKGKKVGVMHACGHDNHMAILMGTAEILASMKNELKGTVKFIFQPAEEGSPNDEDGGASMMVREGVLENPKVDAIFGLHVGLAPNGVLAYRPGPFMASMDTLKITVRGTQTHGALPWSGVDPITVSSQIILALQNIVSRQVNLAKAPAIISIGSIHGGNRENIIPRKVDLLGTVRTFSEKERAFVHRRIRETAKMIAKSAGAKATVKLIDMYPVTVNHEELSLRMVGSLKRAVGRENVMKFDLVTASEDFSYYLQKVPGMFFLLGVKKPDPDTGLVYPNHSPKFDADESSLIRGVRAMSYLALDYLEQES